MHRCGAGSSRGLCSRCRWGWCPRLWVVKQSLLHVAAQGTRRRKAPTDPVDNSNATGNGPVNVRQEVLCLLWR
eukprot:11336149-Prorocentrum_lima.AAC.1